MPLFGIDVSKWNGRIHFAGLKNAGVRFAFIKASQGHALTSDHYLFADSRFRENVEGFTGVGIPVGAYHFFTASDEADADREADFFLDVCRPLADHLTLYLACDAEVYGNRWLEGLGRAELSALIARFCRRVEAAGFAACHYTNTDHIKNRIDLAAIPFPVWQAHYPGGGSVKKPADAGARLAVHQYTDRGQLIGVPGQFDLNFGYAPIARRIIRLRTPLEEQTLDYIARYPTGEAILTRIADKLVLRGLRTVRDDSHPRLVSLLRYHLGLTEEECAYLDAYAWHVELFRKLYDSLRP